jgi:hypothetical protein
MAALAAVAAAVAPPMAVAKKLVAEVIVEAEATRIATLPTTHVASMTPATGSMRSAMTASPPTLHDFATYLFPRNSNLSGSPSTTRNKI